LEPARGERRCQTEGQHLAEGRRTAMPWYVAYRRDGSTVMHVCDSRASAIGAACRLIAEGSDDDIEVGPMLGLRQDNVVKSDELHRIYGAQSRRTG
jgi:hypothetical protein